MNISGIIDYLKKPENKLYLYTAILFLAVFLIIIFVLLGKIFGGKLKTYEQLENVMQASAKRYYENKKKIRKDDSFKSSVKIDYLIKNEYMKELKKYGKKYETCTGSVNVIYNGAEFLYTPYLDCGKAYKTKTLAQKLIGTKVQDNGSGIYDMGDYYLFRGETPNNYVEFANQLWRVLRINEDGNIRMIQNDIPRDRYVFDDRYNSSCTDREYRCDGFNQFEKSRIKERMFEYYNNKEIFDLKSKKYIVYDNICIGGVKEDLNIDEGLVECNTKSEIKYPLDFVKINETISPSLDDNCENIKNRECSNYNFMNNLNGGSYWTATPVAETTTKAYYISDLPHSSYLSESLGLRFVVTLSKDTLYGSGKGTEEKPYKIKEVG